MLKKFFLAGLSALALTLPAAAQAPVDVLNNLLNVYNGVNQGANNNWFPTQNGYYPTQNGYYNNGYNNGYYNDGSYPTQGSYYNNGSYNNGYPTQNYTNNQGWTNPPGTGYDPYGNLIQINGDNGGYYNGGNGATTNTQYRPGATVITNPDGSTVTLPYYGPPGGYAPR